MKTESSTAGKAGAREARGRLRISAARKALRETKLPAGILRAAKGSLRASVRIGGRIQRLADGILTVRAIEMRLAGAQWAEIGDELGVDESLVFAMVEGALARTRALEGLNLEHLRDIESRRLDMYLQALLPACRKGDTSAINTALSVQARRARLLGLDITPDIAAVQFNDNRMIVATPEAVAAALRRAPRVLEAA